MAYRDSSYGGFGGSVTPWVKRLLIANTAVFVVVLILGLLPGMRGLVDYLAFAPRDFITRPWTLVTYAFVHRDVMHLLGNVLTLFFFGPPLEERWGSRAFLRFYLIAAAGGALFCSLLFVLDPAAWIIGASAATFGVMLAFAMIWPEMPIHLFGVFPVKAKWLVAGLAFINLSMAMSGSGGNVAVLAHLGGLLTAFLYLKSPWGPREWGEVPTRRPAKRKAGVLAGWTTKVRRAAEPSTPQAPTPAATNAAERQLLDDVDRILDKISEQGLASLSPEERTRLDEVSRRYRTN